MNSLRQYILTVIGAAIIYSIITQFTSKKTTLHAILKLICGVFLVITIISPLKVYSDYDFSAIFDAYSDTADAYVDAGIKYAETEKEAFIIENAKSYILDRAKELDVCIDANVTLDKDTGLPNSVELSGDISPLKRSRLQSIITDGLGIPEEQQIWQ